MRQHPEIGAEVVRRVPCLKAIALSIRGHHERWDGKGYPDGLAREAIPLPARVFSVADVLDALTTDRPYRPASPMSAAREVITREAGHQFDPAVVAAFNTIPDQVFERIRGELAGR